MSGSVDRVKKHKPTFLRTLLVLISIIVGVAFIWVTVALQQLNNTAVVQVEDENITTIRPTDCSVERCVALTFDDGPTEYTNILLDTLEQNDSRATFFFVGHRMYDFQGEMIRAHSNGHDLGNHTWDHITLTENNPETIVDQVDRSRKAIKDITGVEPILFRPPSGAYNEDHVTQINLPFIMWSVNPIESTETDEETIYERVMSGVQPGSIVLSHDIYAPTVEAYRRIIPELIEQGYRLVTVTDLLDIDDSPQAKAYYQYPE
jgi:peptidoglycan/xylan/chitin deacetylase (PgdA/CDA1 family)